MSPGNCFISLILLRFWWYVFHRQCKPPSSFFLNKEYFLWTLFERFEKCFVCRRFCWCVFDVKSFLCLPCINPFSILTLPKIRNMTKKYCKKKEIGWVFTSYNSFGPVYTNPDTFQSADFFYESVFRPHETSESAHRNRIFLKPLAISRIDFFESGGFSEFVWTHRQTTLC